MAGYRIVSPTRENCTHFSLLVPFECQSTAPRMAFKPGGQCPLSQ